MIDKIKNLPSLVFVLIGVVFAAMIYLGDLSTAETLQSQLSQTDAQLAEKTTSFKKAQNAAQEIASIKTEIEKTSQTLSMAEALAPKDLTIRPIIESVSKEAKDSGIRVVASKPRDVSSKNFYDEVPMEVEFEGSYPQLTLFMYMLSKQKIILHVRDVDLSVKEILDGQTNLRMRAELLGFKYKEAPK